MSNSGHVLNFITSLHIGGILYGCPSYYKVEQDSLTLHAAVRDSQHTYQTYGETNLSKMCINDAGPNKVRSIPPPK